MGRRRLCALARVRLNRLEREGKTTMSDGGAWTPDYVTVTPMQELPADGWGLDLSSLPGWLTDLQKVAQTGVDTYSKIYQLQHSGTTGQSPAPTPNLPAPLPASSSDESSAPLPATTDPATTAPTGFTADIDAFYQANKTAVIIGGIGIAGIVLLLLMRNARSSSS
jgi:hypothetical protein